MLYFMFLFCSYPIIGMEKSQSGRFVLLQLWLQLWPQLRRETSTVIAKRSLMEGARVRQISPLNIARGKFLQTMDRLTEIEKHSE